jgi:hypothetical protein
MNQGPIGWIAWWKKPRVEILWHCPFKNLYHECQLISTFTVYVKMLLKFNITSCLSNEIKKDTKISRDYPFNRLQQHAFRTQEIFCKKAWISDEEGLTSQSLIVDICRGRGGNNQAYIVMMDQINPTARQWTVNQMNAMWEYTTSR